MPSYEFRCNNDKCEVIHVATASIAEAESKLEEYAGRVCGVNRCKGILKRLYSPTAAVFKGSGWAGKG